MFLSGIFTAKAVYIIFQHYRGGVLLRKCLGTAGDEDRNLYINAGNPVLRRADGIGAQFSDLNNDGNVDLCWPAGSFPEKGPVTGTIVPRSRGHANIIADEKLACTDGRNSRVTSRINLDQQWFRLFP
jgi:hypothetical protein